MRTSEAATTATETKPAGLATKLAKAMGEIGRVPKRGRNDAQRYSYARADDVAEQTRDVLSKYGIAVFASVSDRGQREIQGKNGPIRIETVWVDWTFKDGETGEERTVKIPGDGMDYGDKGIYKAMTGAMKYALMLGFLIPTGDGDPERDTDEEEPAKPPPRQHAPIPAAAVVVPPAALLERKIRILEWFERRYKPEHMLSALERVAGRPFPPGEEPPKLTVKELEALEKHKEAEELGGEDERQAGQGR